MILSFAIAGLICACAALAYAEMATMIPASGSAYTYTYVVIGELVAWIVGWSLILEYCLVVSAVAVGWSGYAAPLLQAWLGVPMELMQGPELGGIINLPAIFIIAVIAGLLILGTKESATLNALLVLVKIAALIVFVAVAMPYFNAVNLEPFMPFGFPKTMGPDGVERGVMAAAAIIFFAFYGFDAIATAAEETKNPARDLVDRHRRIDGRLRDHLHGGRRGGDRRDLLHALRQQPRAAGADPARARPARRRQISRGVGG